MTLSSELEGLYNAGADQLYPIYGVVIDIVEFGSGSPELLIAGEVEDIETDIKALAFPLTTYEKEMYGTGYGEDSKKFVFDTDTILDTKYLIREGTDLYEIFKLLNRKAVGKYRVIAKRSEDV
ncbi:MAG: hypothetical protein KAR20_28070 [Candidatus Heimdallarchaeota archaeon]|nr:hypothetical protein [Candidatus Heimdallarchaeota archaeon]